jgi:hypothetical protein
VSLRPAALGLRQSRLPRRRVLNGITDAVRQGIAAATPVESVRARSALVHRQSWVAHFIGSNLTISLLADGHEVIGLDAFTNNYNEWRKQSNIERERLGRLRGCVLAASRCQRGRVVREA